jgi:hypothetical protein
LDPDSVANLTVYVSVSDPDSIESADPYRESPRQAKQGPKNSQKNEDILCLNYEELLGSFSLSLQVLFMGSEEIYSILRSIF